jgi:hypothetical protein
MAPIRKEFTMKEMKGMKIHALRAFMVNALIDVGCLLASSAVRIAAKRVGNVGDRPLRAHAVARVIERR